MKIHLLTAALAIVAIGGASASQNSTKVENATADNYFIKDPTCRAVQCDTPPDGPLCSSLTLYSSCESTEEITNAPGYIVIP